jgi:cytochrome c oxidase subunit 1
MYPPLSSVKETLPGSGLGTTLWLISMAIFIVATTMGSLNYITTILNLRTKGMTMGRLPLTVWAFLITSIWVFSVLPTFVLRQQLCSP